MAVVAPCARRGHGEGIVAMVCGGGSEVARNAGGFLRNGQARVPLVVRVALDMARLKTIQCLALRRVRRPKLVVIVGTRGADVGRSISTGQVPRVHDCQTRARPGTRFPSTLPRVSPNAQSRPAGTSYFVLRTSRTGPPTSLPGSLAPISSGNPAANQMPVDDSPLFTLFISKARSTYTSWP